MHTPALALLGLAVAIGVAACSSTPERIPQLDQAQADVQRVEMQPEAQQAAGESLRKAQEALTAAEEAQREDQGVEAVRQSAYLATRYAQTAQAQIDEYRARKVVEEGESERNRVLLQARTQEAENAKLAAEQAQSEADRLRQEMEMLQAQSTDRGMIVTLGDVLFDSGRATLKPGATLTLDRLASVLVANPGLMVQVEGHTDSQGGEEYNLQLSDRRAYAVRDALTSRGISPTRIQTRGLGEAFPVATNDTAAGRQQNRRVEVVFSDPDGRFVSSVQGR
jgi:outer membrane protein OmpA-like peptidoglycan-associated protein